MKQVKTFKSSGVTFNVVNELPTQVKNQFLKVVNEYLVLGGQDLDRVENILEFIAGGACGKVFALGEDYIVKINTFGWNSRTRDGQILHELQGVPFIPKIYWYSDDNRFMIIQRIKGQTVHDYRFRPKFTPKKEWSQEAHEKACQEAFDMAMDRGWTMNDCHDSNTMIDEEGNFWVVDVGLFKDEDSWSFGCGDLGDIIEAGYSIMNGIDKLQAV
jgi:hypothetical protein